MHLANKRGYQGRQEHTLRTRSRRTVRIRMRATSDAMTRTISKLLRMLNLQVRAPFKFACVCTYVRAAAQAHPLMHWFGSSLRSGQRDAPMDLASWHAQVSVPARRPLRLRNLPAVGRPWADM